MLVYVHAILYRKNTVEPGFFHDLNIKYNNNVHNAMEPLFALLSFVRDRE